MMEGFATRTVLQLRTLIVTGLLFTVAPSHSSSLSTVDILRNRHMISDDFIMRQNRKCDMRRLCASDEMRIAAICGTDGRTYNSLCEIKRARCHGNPIVMKFRGECPDELKCQLERSFSEREVKRKNQTSVFIPECEKDGSYSIVQCHQSTGYCWCVTKLGIPLPGTSVQHKRPNCLPQGKVGRRSSRRQLGRRRRGCNTADRSTFNANLVKLFRSEYDRIARRKTKYKSLTAKHVTMSTEKRIIEWKFDQLDASRDNRLSRREIRGLRKMAKSYVQPFACAKRFTRYCDLDQNRKIERREWLTCLGVDINRMALAYIQANLQAQSIWNEQSGTNFLLRPENNAPSATPTETAETPEPDCRSHRARALKDHKRNPESSIYVPDCAGHNNRFYASVQCHRSTQYCWCATPDAGKPIAGTSVQYVRPNCDKRTKKKELGEIKGCTEPKRQRFYQRLYATLESSMIASGQARQSERMSRKESAVRWKFHRLDTNQNSVLSRREWKGYRLEMKLWKGVRKCGRNFMRFCDQNEDRRITLDEWLDCTLPADTSALSHHQLFSRRGPNPLERLLKGD